MIRSVLSFCGGHGPKVLFIGVFLGLAAPDLAALLRPHIGPIVGILLFFSLLRIEWQTMSSYFRHPFSLVALLVWLLVISPALIMLLLLPFPLPEALETALILMAAAPPILGASAIALLVGLDAALAIVVGLIATLLAPLTVPPVSFWLLGVELDVSTYEFMLRMGMVVGGAFLASLVVRKLAGNYRLRTAAREIDGAIVLVMLVFAIGIMDGVTATLFQRPYTVALWVAAAFIANPLLQVSAFLVFFKLGRSRALTAGLMSGNCNMGLLLASLPETTDYDVALFFALAQLPMYMLPALCVPLYRHLLPASEDSP
ncbi:hypothetical protein [Fodinicurvata sediminis]|uniref:hypothetical protein n=1 Tax=Fodinicurvata sediminis TaxID=1121832 RepID=UPI00047CE965|nr:hypothetical protein [Fodinicurvata sediminis]